MSHHDLAALVSEAIDAVCSGTDHPFEERAVVLWVLQYPAVAAQRGSPEYEDIETRVRTEVPAQLRTRIDEMGERVYLAGDRMGDTSAIQCASFKSVRTEMMRSCTSW